MANHRTSPMLVLAVLIVGIGLGAAGVHFFLRGANGTKAAPVVARNTPKLDRVSALGRIEPQGGIVSVGIPIPDRLLEIYPNIYEGATVTRGQPLAKLQNYLELDAKVKILELQIQEAKDRLDGINKNGEAQIAVDTLRIKQHEQLNPVDEKLQKLKISVLTQQAEAARSNYERVKALKGTVSKQELEQQELLKIQAESELESAKESLVKLKKSQELTQEAARAQLRATQATLERSRGEIPLASLEKQSKLAEEARDRMIINAPIDGKILKVFARPGELVGAQQPILQVANTNTMVVIAEVYETDIGRVKKGQRAKITGRALQGTLEGEVVQIGGVVGRNRVFDADPLADVDRRIVEVTIRLDQPDQAASLINLQVQVEVLTGQ